MPPKRGIFTFILIVSCAALANSLIVDTMSGTKSDFKDMAKKLMMKCQNNGYQVPKMMLLSTVFNNSDLPTVDKNTHPSNAILSIFLNVLNSVTVDTNKGLFSLVPMDDAMTNKMWNCTNLPHMIMMMKNLSEASSCYIRAFLAPVSWTTLTTQGKNNVSSDDYDTLLWAAKPALQDMRSLKISLPTQIEGQNLKKMMMMLQETYGSMSEDQRTDIVKWAKEQITQSYYNCTLRSSSDPISKLMNRCKPSLKWLNFNAMTMLGPFLSHLAPGDVDRCPLENLCEYFLSAQSNSTFNRATKMKPSLGNMFLQRIQECFTGKEKLVDQMDKLGTLACYYYNATDITPDLSKKYLSQLDNCTPNPKIKQLKKHLLNSMMSNSNITQALCELGSNVALLSAKQLSMIPNTTLKEILKNLGPSVQWTQSQLTALVKKQLGDKKCNKVSGEELLALQSAAGGLPSCVLKQVKAWEILNYTEALKNISKAMRKGQLKAMLQGLQGDADPTELVQKLVEPLLHSISLTRLKKVNITSLDQVENKTWSLSQAAYLAKKLQDLKQLQQYGRLHSILQGISCNMIDKLADNDTQNLAQALTENPQWLSKVLAGCAARKLFAILERERSDYFKTITGNELDKIPTSLLLHLPPSKVQNLPDSVCPVFLDKMEVANLSSLPLRSPSRPALTQRALLCLGKNISKMTTEDISRLGPLLCELSPSQLRLMAPDVLNSSLLAMTSCQFIPQNQRAELIYLVKKTFGDPSYWSSETMEALGPLLILDDNTTSALPNKPWMKDILYFLKSRVSYDSDALRKKFFDLTTTTKSSAARKKREANRINSIINAEAPTVDMIENLGMDNVYWTPAHLNMMSNETFLSCVETLGATHGYNADQLTVLIKKATEVFGPVSQMNESVVTQLGCITQGFFTSDLEKCPFSLESLEKIAHCGWNESQMEAVWKGVAKYNNLTAQQLGAADIVALNQFICGLNSSEIGFLNKEAFKDAVGSMDGVQCSFKVTQQLKNLVVSAFGHPSTWTEAQVTDLGNIIAGLNASELAALNTSVFSFVSKTCIPLIPPANFAALSVAQLEALGPDNAAKVTTEQKAALKNDQRAALESAETGTRAQAQTSAQAQTTSAQAQISAQSGAPPVSVVTKSLLFLFMGFLLL